MNFEEFEASLKQGQAGPVTDPSEVARRQFEQGLLSTPIASSDTPKSALDKSSMSVQDWLTKNTPPRRDSFHSVVVEPWQEALTGPTFFDNPFLKLGERALSLAGAPFENLGRAGEAVAEQAPRLVGAEPISSPESRMVGLAGSLGVGAGAATGLARAGLRAAGRALPELPALAKATKAVTELPGIKQVTDLYSKGLSPLLSRIAKLDPVGERIVQMESLKTQREYDFMRTYIMPLYNKLRKLGEPEKAELVGHLEGTLTTPVSAKTAQLADEFNNVFGMNGVVVQEAQRLGVNIQPRQNFFMHEFSPDFMRSLARDKALQSQIAQRLYTTGQASTPREARYIVDNMLARPKISFDRKTMAEFKREYDIPGYIKDPALAVIRRGERLAERFASVETYGHRNKYVRDMIGQIADPVVQDKMRKAFELTLGGQAIDDDLAKWVRAGLTVQAFTKLPLAFAANLSQPALGSLRTDLTNLAKGLFHHLKNPMASARESTEFGMLVDMATRKAMGELAEGGGGGKWMNRALSFYNFSERVVRHVAYQMGNDWARRIESQVANAGQLGGRQLRALTRELDRLGFDNPEIQRLYTTGAMLPKDIDRVKWALADQIVFFPRAARRSEFYQQYPPARLLLQFKSFLGNAGRLFHDTVINEAKAGNIGPLLRMTYTLPTLSVIGEVASDFRSSLTGGRRAPPVGVHGVMARAIDNLSAVGALGVGTEIMNLVAEGRDLSSFLLGPTGGDLIEAQRRLSGLTNADTPEEFKRQGYELFRSGLRRVPGIGPFGANVVFPSSSRKPMFKDENTGDRLGLTDRSEERKIRSLLERARRRKSLYENIGD